VYGNILFEKKNAPMVIIVVIIIRGLIIRGNEMPADFMASNSLFSPKLPRVISEANRVDKGNAIGTKLAEA
jgi:hypothetical protein